MNVNQLYNKLFCVMQWSIGFSKGSIEQIIRQKKSKLTFKWMPLSDSRLSIADPFIFKDQSGNLNMIYEKFSMSDLKTYGKIAVARIDGKFNATGSKEIFDPKSHSSYPFVFVENGKTYVIPETSHQQRVSAYEYDFVNQALVNERVLIDLPLLDSTIFKHNNKYWLFATLSDHQFDHSKLYIYYADSLFGTYKPHANNPVKNNLDGSRPAGSMIMVDGQIYRPAQNCGQHYGESISINRVTTLSEDRFAEELYFKITPDKSCEFNSGVHTINFVDDVIVIDGVKMQFRPLTKWRLFIEKKLKNINA